MIPGRNGEGAVKSFFQYEIGITSGVVGNFLLWERSHSIMVTYPIQARQTRPNSGGVAEGRPRFDKGGVAIIFYFLRVKNRTF